MPIDFTSHSKCTYCDSSLNELLHLGVLPPVNVMEVVIEQSQQLVRFPLTLAICKDCQLVQIKEELASKDVFPDSYPYLSGTTQILRKNFANQYVEVNAFIPLTKTDLLVDIGSNDGTLLSNYINTCEVLGIEPTSAAAIAQKNGIRTWKTFFDRSAAEKILKTLGKAKVVTACNVFAHIPNLKTLMSNVVDILRPDGVFVTESHYLYSLLENLQFDTIYHEHLRYYSVTFLNRLFSDFNFEIIRVQSIQTHGGSIRVWAAKKGVFTPDESVKLFLNDEEQFSTRHSNTLENFADRVLEWRNEFCDFISSLKAEGLVIGAIGAPSRASTLISFSGLSHLEIVAVGEISTSHKIGRYMPGTRIPVVDERKLVENQPDYLLLLSWHIAEELMPKLREIGFRGRFIIPLPELRVI